MNLFYFFFVIISVMNLTSAHKNLYAEIEVVPNNCTEVRNSFGLAASKFTECSIRFSRPIKFCRSCINEYLDVLNMYRNMSEVKINGISCIEYFVDKDRLGIIHTLYEDNKNLWNRAKCNDCFVTVDGHLTNNISSITETFAKYYEEFNNCLNFSNDAEICTGCMDLYVSFQNYFLSISNENEKIGVCMDLVDTMNTTWIYWGEKCCGFRRHNEVVFLITTSAVIGATVLFYIFAQIYTKKKTPTISEQRRFHDTFES